MDTTSSSAKEELSEPDLNADEPPTPPEASEPDSKPALPWVADHICLDEEPHLIKNLAGLDPRLQDYLKQEGFAELFPVQWSVWSQLRGGLDVQHDLCMVSPTGSGKTLAYALPIAQSLSRYAAAALHFLGAVIVLPTQSLASQVFKVTKPLFARVGLRVEMLGKSDIWAETKMLQTAAQSNSDPCAIRGLSEIQVIVTTPGILETHLKETRALTLKHLRFLVVDEYDALLRRRSFETTAFNILTAIKESQCEAPPVRMAFWPRDSSRARVLKILASATVSYDPATFSHLDLYCPRLLAPRQENSKYTLPAGLKEFQVVCPAPLRPLILAKLLMDMMKDRALVFAQTIETAHRVFLMLNAMETFKGQVVEFSSQMSARDKNTSLRKFQKKQIILIASDAMSRGMDVQNVDAVINYDMPARAKTYIHRVGRTARAGRPGRAYSLIRKEVEEDLFSKLRSKIKMGNVDSLTLDVEELRALKPQVDEAVEKMKTMCLRPAGQRMKKRSRNN